MSFPKVGMHFEDCRRRCKRISASKEGNKQIQSRLVESLKNQAELHQKGAGEEITREIDTNRHNLPRLGWSKTYAKNYDKIFSKKL